MYDSKFYSTLSYFSFSTLRVQHLGKVSILILENLKQVLLKVLMAVLILGTLKKEYPKYGYWNGRLH